MSGRDRRDSAGESHFYQHRHPAVAAAADARAAQPGASDERTPVLPGAAPERPDFTKMELEDFQAHQRELEEKHRRSKAILELGNEVGIGPELELDRDPVGAVPPIAMASVPERGSITCVQSLGRGCWCQQCIPFEELQRGYARLKSAAGRAPVSDGNAPLVRVGSTGRKVEFRTCWEKLWRFFALSMDSADERSGYLDKLRFENLLRKRAQLTDRAVIKQLWTLAISRAKTAKDGVSGGGGGGGDKLRYCQREEKGPEGFIEFLEAWSKERKSRAEAEREARRASGLSARGGSGASLGSASASASASSSAESGSGGGGGKLSARSNDSVQSARSGSTTTLVSSNDAVSDWMDLARQRSLALPSEELAEVYSLPTLQPREKEDFLKGLRRLRKASSAGTGNKAQWQKIFAKFDSDRSGRLELNEFQAMMDINSGYEKHLF